MKNIIIYSLVAGGILASQGLLYADHDKACKNVHGKVTTVTDDSVTVGEKLYKVGKSTRLTKNEKPVKLENIATGDMVCLDPRGKDDIGGGEVASVAVLTVSDSPTKEYVRETVRQVSHDKGCNHIHGKVTRIEESTLMVDGKPYLTTTTTRITKDGQVEKIETIKSGDYVCMDGEKGKVASVVVLNATEATPFQVREREVIREKIREDK